MVTEGYSHVMQDTPAAVWIPGAQTLSTCPVLLTWLDGNLGNLKAHEKVRVTVQHDKRETSKQDKKKLWVLITSQTPTDDLSNIYFTGYIKPNKSLHPLAVFTFDNTSL